MNLIKKVKLREESGKLLQNDVKRVDDKTYSIKSSNGKETYQINATTIG